MKNKVEVIDMGASTKIVTVCVSGGFDPIHVGHIRYINEAKKLGDRLVVILNNDNWLVKKKNYAFMNENDRKEILESLASVDQVVISYHEKDPKDMSVCAELEVIKPTIFCNGGDRISDNVPEVGLCKELGIETRFNVGKGGKLRSSSDLVKNAKLE